MYGKLSVERISFLKQLDVVTLDPDRLDELHIQLGPMGAETVITRAMDELGQRFFRLRELGPEGDPDEIYRVSRNLAAISDQIGLITLSRVARDVADCALLRDRVAFGATHARLYRIADGSLNAVLDMSGQSI